MSNWNFRYKCHFHIGDPDYSPRCSAKGEARLGTTNEIVNGGADVIPAVFQALEYVNIERHMRKSLSRPESRVTG